MDFFEAKEILGQKFAFSLDFLNKIVQELNLDKDVKILDVGTGNGRMAITLALNNYKVLTGEPKSDNSEYAKKEWLIRAKKVNVDHLITFKHFNAEKMPFESTFNIIFMLGVLHHIDNPVSAFKEFIRVLKPNGIICIIEPNRRAIRAIKKKHPKHSDAADPRDYSGDLPVKIKKGALFNAFIFEKA